MRQYVEFHDKRGTAYEWATKNPVLDSGEHGFEWDTGKFKIGDGVSKWIDLPYFVPEGESTPALGLDEHINSETPHPVYDDGPDLMLLYLNAKV